MEGSEVRTIGKYQILGPLGRGSMGLVYKGRDPEIGRLVAIKTLRKLLPTHMQSADSALERFRNEARSAGNLRHPRIITIFEVSRDGDTPYIVMDYVEGDSLESVLEREKKLTLDRTLHYLAQVAEGLDYAHEKGVIHKDIKPGNIFVDRAHNVFILDFGIATINESIPEDGAPTAPALGTPGYMSPEQILSEKTDLRTDLFSLAIVAFECLTGQRPFPGATFTEVVGNILNAKPLSLTQLAPELPLGLEAEFERALAKEPSRRYSSAQEMVESLAKAAGLTSLGNRGYLKRGSDEASWKTPFIGSKSGVGQQDVGEKAAPRDDFVSGGAASKSSGGWAQSQTPGDLFGGDNNIQLVSSVLSSTRLSGLQALTFILGAVAVVIACILFYTVFRPPTKERPHDPSAVVAGSGNPELTHEVLGDLVIPEVEEAPAGLPVDALSDKQLLGVLVNPASPETLLVDVLRKGLVRKTPQLVDACARILQHDSYVVRIETIKTVAQIGDRRIVPKLLLNLDDHDPLVRGQAAKALGSLGDRAALGYLTQRMVSEEDAEVRTAMQSAIEKINGFPLARGKQ